MTAQMNAETQHIPATHRERFRLAERPENEGETFRSGDYMVLVLATVVAPALMILLAWLA